MIINIIFALFVVFFNIITSWLPTVTELPFGLDTTLATAVSYFHGITETVPYLQVVWTCFLYVLGFEILMLVLKLFLGSRTPHNLI